MVIAMIEASAWVGVVGFPAVALGRAVLFDSGGEWRRVVALATILCVLALLGLLTHFVPRQATRMARTLRGLIGPMVLICGMLLGLAAVYATLGPHPDEDSLPFFPAVYKAVQYFALNPDPRPDGRSLALQ